MPHRIERVNSVIREEISEMLQRQVKDPRLGAFITVTEVTTSPDLKYARIYVSQLGGEVDRRKVLSGLASASGFFRSELAKRMKLRHVPELHFEWDDSIERGDRLTQLIDQVSRQENG